MTWQYLDWECAKAAEDTLKELVGKTCEEAQRLVSDAGSVLPKQGPSAMVLYLQQKGKKNRAAEILLSEVNKVLLKIPSAEGCVNARASINKLSTNLSDLLLARKLLILYLAYLKYQLKVKAGDA